MREDIKERKELIVEKLEERREKISGKILKRVGTPTCIIFLVVAIVLIVLIQVRLNDAKEKELTLESQSVSNELNTFLQKYLKSVSHLAVNPQVVDTVSSADKTHKMTELKEYHDVFEYMVNMQEEDSGNIMAVWIASVSGNVLAQSDGYVSGSDFEITSREWYAAAKTKTAMLTRPYVDASTGQTILSAAAPVMDDAGKVVGVAGLDLALTHVSEVLAECKIGETGYVLMTTGDGTIIYHPNSSYIQKTLEEIGVSSDITSLVKAGSDGFDSYKINGEKRYGYVSAIDDTGYIVISSLSSGEFYEELVQIIVLMVVIFIAGIVIIFIAIKKSAIAITKPIEALDVAAQELAEGNLNVNFEITTNDEIGALGRSIQQTVSRLKLYIAYIDEVSAVLEKMADGKLAVSLKQDYAGEFGKIKDALLNISSSMTEVLTGIKESSNQVSAGAEDLASASQTLAEGASTQAASIEEIVATTDSIVAELQASKDDALNCAVEAEKVSEIADNSKIQMKDMLEAMNKISDTSNQVVGIIHTIEEIADQTNLLALNASIEAARAGEAGRGFAVVASEIGALANQSAEAAANTKNLIGVSMAEIERGVALAGQVTDTLETVVDNVSNVSVMVKHTADLAVEQEENMVQMQAGIDTIAQAIQDTSATAQESSATSEELAAQAEVLDGLIKRFDLDK